MNVSLERRDWSLHRKGPIDEARHKEKVKEAIRGDIADIISEEAIITSDGQKVVKVPVRSVELPTFRYNPKNQQHVGQGSGESKVGDVIGPAADAKGAGKGKAGDQLGFDYYETELTIDDLANVLFEELGLPNLRPQVNRNIESQQVKWTDRRKSGPMSRLDIRRTVLENIRRNALEGREPKFSYPKNEDLRFRLWEHTVERQNNAVVIAMRDVSGSMGEFEKFITRSFYFWMVRFLRTKYQGVDIRFITHHSTAKEVDEHGIFHFGESGGTVVSTAYKLALGMIRTDYPSGWNIYPFHFTDGDNWGDADNNTCVDLVRQMFEAAVNLFGYGEIKENGQNAPKSRLLTALSEINDARFVPVIINSRQDIHPALKRFLPKEDLEALMI